MLMCLQRCEERGQWDPQSIRNADEAEDREVAAALLNLANVRRIQARSGSECWLGESLLLSIVADSRSKKLEQCG